MIAWLLLEPEDGDIVYLRNFVKLPLYHKVSHSRRYCHADWMLEYIGPLFTSASQIAILSSDCTLHWNYSDFKLDWALGPAWLDYDSLRLLVASHYRAYNISAQTTSKTPFPRIPGVFTSPLPRDGRPSIVACTYVAGVFTEPLPSNRSMRHKNNLHKISSTVLGLLDVDKHTHSEVTRRTVVVLIVNAASTTVVPRYTSLIRFRSLDL
jgi:hypothetical protein